MNWREPVSQEHLIWLADSVRRHGLVATEDAVPPQHAHRVSPMFRMTLEYEPRSLCVHPSGQVLAVGTKSGRVDMAYRSTETGQWIRGKSWAVEEQRAVRVLAFAGPDLIVSSALIPKVFRWERRSTPAHSPNIPIRNQTEWLRAHGLSDDAWMHRLSDNPLDRWLCQPHTWLPFGPPDSFRIGILGLLLTRSQYARAVFRMTHGDIKSIWIDLATALKRNERESTIDVRLPLLAATSHPRSLHRYVVDSASRVYRVQIGQTDDSLRLSVKTVVEGPPHAVADQHVQFDGLHASQDGLMLRAGDWFGFIPWKHIEDKRAVTSIPSSQWRRIPNAGDFCAFRPYDRQGRYGKWTWMVCSTPEGGLRWSRWDHLTGAMDDRLGVSRTRLEVDEQETVRIEPGWWNNPSKDRPNENPPFFLAFASRDHSLRIVSVLDFSEVIPVLKYEFRRWVDQGSDPDSLTREPGLARILAKMELDYVFRQRRPDPVPALFPKTSAQLSNQYLSALTDDDLSELVRYFTRYCLDPTAHPDRSQRPLTLSKNTLVQVQSWIVRFMEAAQGLRRGESGVVLRIASMLEDGLSRLRLALGAPCSPLDALSDLLRKWVRFGHTYASKPLDLERLVELNAGAGRHLDALTYATALLARRVDGMSRVSFPSADLSPAVRSMATGAGARKSWGQANDRHSRPGPSETLIFHSHQDGRITASDTEGRPGTWAPPPKALGLDVRDGGLVLRLDHSSRQRTRGDRYARALTYLPLTDQLGLLAFSRQAVTRPRSVFDGGDSQDGSVLFGLVLYARPTSSGPRLELLPCSRYWVVDFEVHAWAIANVRSGPEMWHGILLAGIRLSPSRRAPFPFRELEWKVPLSEEGVMRGEIEWCNHHPSTNDGSHRLNYGGLHTVALCLPPWPTLADATRAVTAVSMVAVQLRPYEGDGCTLLWVGRDDGRLEVYEGFEQGAGLRSAWQLLDDQRLDSTEICEPGAGGALPEWLIPPVFNPAAPRLVHGDPVEVTNRMSDRKTRVEWCSIRPLKQEPEAASASRRRDVDYHELEIVDDPSPALDDYLRLHAEGDATGRLVDGPQTLERIQAHGRRPVRYRHPDHVGRLQIDPTSPGPERVRLQPSWSSGWVRSEAVERIHETGNHARTRFIDARPLEVGSPITALAVAGDDGQPAQLGNPPCMMAYGTSDGLIVLRWLVKKGGERPVPAFNLVETREQSPVIRLAFCSCDNLPQLMAITESGRVSVFDALPRARTRDVPRVGPTELSVENESTEFRGLAGHRRDRFQLPVNGRAATIWPALHRDDRRIPGITIGATSGEIHTVRLVAGRGSPRRNTLAADCAEWFEQGKKGVPNPCPSNLTGVALAVNSDHKKAWRLIAAIDVLGWMQCSITRMDIRRYATRLVDDTANAMEEDRVSHFINLIVDYNDELYQRRPVLSETVKSLWEETGTALETITARCRQWNRTQDFVQLARLLHALEAMGDRWVDTDEARERSLLVHGFHMVYSGHMHTIILDGRSAGLRFRKPLITRLIHRRLTHRDPLVALETLRWINLRGFEVLIEILSGERHTADAWTLGVSAFGKDSTEASSPRITHPTQPHRVYGLKDLMTAVMALGIRAAERTRRAEPTLYEVCRFFGACIVTMPQYALLVAILISESRLDARNVEIGRRIIAQAYAIIWQLENEYGLEVPAACHRAAERLSRYLDGTLDALPARLIEDTRHQPLSDGQVWHQFGEVARVANALQRPPGEDQEGDRHIESFLNQKPPALFEHSYVALATLRDRRREVFQRDPSVVSQLGEDRSAAREQPYWKRLDACARTEWWLRHGARIYEPQRTRYLRIVEHWRIVLRREREAARVIIECLDQFNRHVFRATADNLIDTLNELVLQEQPFILGDMLRKDLGRLDHRRVDAAVSDAFRSIDTLSLRHLVRESAEEARPLIKRLHELGMMLAEQAEASSILLTAARLAVEPSTDGFSLGGDGTTLHDIETMLRGICQHEGLDLDFEHEDIEPRQHQLRGHSSFWRAVLVELAHNISKYGLAPDPNSRLLSVRLTRSGPTHTLCLHGNLPFSRQIAEAYQDRILEIVEGLDGSDTRIQGKDRSMGYGLKMVRALCQLVGLGYRAVLGDPGTDVVWDDAHRSMGMKPRDPLNAPLVFLLWPRDVR